MELTILVIDPIATEHSDFYRNYLGKDATQHWKDRWKNETKVSKITLIESTNIVDGLEKLKSNPSINLIIVADYLPEDKAKAETWDIDFEFIGLKFNGAVFIRQLRNLFKGPIIGVTSDRFHQTVKPLKEAGATYVHCKLGVWETLLNIMKVDGLNF